MESKKQNEPRQKETHEYKEQIGGGQRGWAQTGAGQGEVEASSSRMSTSWDEGYSLGVVSGIEVGLSGDRWPSPSL